jgi:Holliday junction resolvasome RuvABC endonuclease subunit
MIEIMGGDLSLTATGLCLPDGSTTTIKTGGADKGDQRLVIMRQAFTHHLRCWPIDLMVLERAGQFQSGDAALAVGMAHGIIREVLAEFKVPYAYIAPTVVKQFATGRGGADKKEMVIACNQAKRRSTESPGKDITDHNQADAWWLRQMGVWWDSEDREVLRIGEIGQVDMDGHGIRHRAVYGPWPKNGGAKWPDRLRTAITRS